MVLLLGSVGAMLISIATDGWGGFAVGIIGGVLMWLSGMEFEKREGGSATSDSEPG